MSAEDQKPRLSRLDQVFVHFPIYFVTTCTYRRRKLLSTSAVHEAFLEFAKAGPAHGVWVGPYVIMPDHLHAFVATDDQRISLSAWMKSLKNTLSKALRRNGVAQPHWQKTFFDHLLRSHESYSQKWSYVRENPVRAGLVANAEDWRLLGQVFALDYHSD
jgi:REP element-mobilizing transposase RayT